MRKFCIQLYFTNIFNFLYNILYDKFNKLNAGAKATSKDSKAGSTTPEFRPLLVKDMEKGKELEKELEQLRLEAVNLGIATP